MDDSELIRQFIEVVISYENIGVKIIGIVSDGGGGNTEFFRMLCDNLPVETHWPGKASIICLNPVDKSRYIYFISCSTHGLKAVRNSLFRSQLKLSRSLQLTVIDFGWREMELIFMKYNDCVQKNKGRRTDLLRHAINLDKYTTMDHM